VNDPADPLRELVNKSGYPLQIAIAHHVNATTMRHGWKVLYEEHGWSDPDTGRHGFIDLVLHFPALNAVMLIECKRLQDTDWILIPKDGESNGRRVARSYRSYLDAQGVRRSAWRDLPLEPRSPIAEFCVMRRTGGTHTVEPVAAELVSATEALAAEEQRYLVAHGNKDARTYYAAIVTTAQLQVCNFEPRAISLKVGTIPENAAFRPVPFVRFTKQLSTVGAARVPPSPQDLSAGWTDMLTESKERTVFLIQAAELDAFLRNYRPDIVRDV
jgi:hypothetical protein